MKIPKRIYHYTKLETALEYILPSATIRLGSIGITNDPRESKDWGFAVMSPPQDLTPEKFLEEMAELQNIANHIRRKEWWFLSTCQDDPNLIVPKLEHVDFSHFDYGFARASMWAHYAQNHRGICLEFDGLALNEAINSAVVPGDLVFSGAVEYNDEFNFARMRHRGDALQISWPDVSKNNIVDGMRQHILARYDLFFLEKTKDWKVEQEFRWLVNSQRGPVEVDIRKSLRSIVVGTDFPSVYGPSIKSLAEKLKVRLERMFWTNRVPSKQLWQ